MLICDLKTDESEDFETVYSNTVGQLSIISALISAHLSPSPNTLVDGVPPTVASDQ